MKFTSALDTDIVRINILYEPPQTNYYLAELRWLTAQQRFDLSPFAYEHLLSRNVNCSHCLFDSQSNTRSRHQAIDMAFVRAFQQSECLSPCSISMDTLTQGRARELTISIQL